MTRYLLLVAALAATVAACGGDDDDNGAAAKAPATTQSSMTAAGGWERVVPGGDCQCSDGSKFSFWVRKANPRKVVFYLEGLDKTTAEFQERSDVIFSSLVIK